MFFLSSLCVAVCEVSLSEAFSRAKNLPVLSFPSPLSPFRTRCSRTFRPLGRASEDVSLRALLIPRRGHPWLSGKQVSLNILFGGLDDTISLIRIQEAGVGDSLWKYLIPSRSAAVGVGGKAGRSDNQALPVQLRAGASPPCLLALMPLPRRSG